MLKSFLKKLLGNVILVNVLLIALKLDIIIKGKIKMNTIGTIFRIILIILDLFKLVIFTGLDILLILHFSLDF